MGVVIVLDPGHGSDEYHGGEFGDYVEKDIDLAVSKALKNRLEMYDNVKVYLTREEDINVDLKARADFAKAKNADYFFSIHFNMSSIHNYYGAEVWLSVDKSNYSKMYPAASELMKNFDGIGLFNRGIKTRPGEHGDYYAVIRHCTNYGIPSCIIEHCHLDNVRDNSFLPLKNGKVSDEALEFFGVTDADAIAKALNLKSSILGVDYSGYKTDKANIKTSQVLPDTQAPYNCQLSVSSVDAVNNTATINIHAETKSYLLYYQISTDGGKTYSELKEWPRSSWNKSSNDCEVLINVPSGKTIEVDAIVYNSYDVCSNCQPLTVVLPQTVNSASKSSPVYEKEITYDNQSITRVNEYNPVGNIIGNGLIRNGLLVFCILLLVIVSISTISLFRRRNKILKIRKGNNSDAKENN